MSIYLNTAIRPTLRLHVAQMPRPYQNVLAQPGIYGSGGRAVSKVLKMAALLKWNYFSHLKF